MRRLLLLFFVIACSYVKTSAQKNVNASFRIDTSYGCSPITVQFTNTSTGNIEFYYWEFGDGTVSSLASPVHVYNKPGKYNATLIVYNQLRDFDTAYHADNAESIFSLPFSIMAGQHLYCGQPTKLSTGLEQLNQPLNYLWSTGANSPSITVSQPGVYTVALTGCEQTFSDTVEVVDATGGMSLSLDEVYWQNSNAHVKFNYHIPFDNRAVSSLLIDYGDSSTPYNFYPGAENRFYTHAGNFRASIIGTMLPGVSDGNCDTAAYLNFTIRESYLGQVSWSGKDTTLQRGQKLTLKAGIAGTSFTWKNSFGSILSTDSVFTIDSEGYFTLTITKDGDERDGYVSVHYKQPYLTPLFSASTLDDCGLVNFGDMSTYNTYPIVKRIWKFGDGVVDSTSASPSHQYTDGGDHYPVLILENSAGMVDSFTNTVYTPLFPAIRLPGDTIIEKGSTLYLTDNNFNTYDYTWSTGETGYGIYVTKSGLYSVTGSTRCPSIVRRDSVYITVDDLAILINQGNPSFCGDSLTLTAVIDGPQDNYSYSWDSNTRDTTLSARVAAPGYYTFSLKNQDGSIRKTQSIYVQQIPRFQVVLQPVNGDQHLIEALIDSSSVSTGYSFRWYKNSEQLQLPAGQNMLQLTDTGYYEVVVTDNAFSCTSIAAPYYLFGSGYGGEVIIPDSTITGNDSMAINTSFAHDFNTTNTFTVQLTLKNAGARTTGLQQEDIIDLGTKPGTSRNVSMNVFLPDTLACASSYALRVVASSPADTSAWSQEFSVSNQPPQPVIRQRGDSLITSGKYNWQWYFNDKPIEGATAAAYRAGVSGVYTVASLNGNDCFSKSAALSVVITGIGDVTLNGNKVKAYPNPSAGEVYLQFEKPLQKVVTIKVYSHSGNVVYSRTTMQQRQPLDLSGLAKGFYVVELSAGGSKKTLSLILQ